MVLGDTSAGNTAVGDVAGGLREGDPAPRFTLRSQHGESVDLSLLAGFPVMVMFYPFAFSRVCTAELTEIFERGEEIQQLGVQVLAISCDALHTLRAYADSLQPGQRFAAVASTGAPPVTLLSDFWPHGDVAASYGALNQSTGAPRRRSFLLDSTLRIQHIISSADGQARSLDAALDQLGQLI